MSKGGSNGLLDVYGAARPWRRGVWSIFAWLLLLVPAPQALGQAISLASFTQAQGLRSLEDNCLVQDHRGFVYVCTENGLFRFDGHMFQRIGADYGLQGSFIAALHEDAANRLWVGTRTGLYVGDGTHFSPVRDEDRPLPVDPGAMLADLDGTVYVVSQHRLWAVTFAGGAWHMRPYFDAQTIRTYPALEDISSVFSDGRTLWLGCGKSLCQQNGGQVHQWSEREGIPEDTWTSYLRMRDGTLWVRSPHYIRSLSPGSQLFTNHDLPGARVVTAYLDMVEDDQGRLLTRANEGLASWDGRHWSTRGTRDGLPDIGIDALLYDRHHTLWIGTYGRGVLQWRGYNRMQSWQTAQGLDSSPTWAMARAKDGALWIGDELGGSVLGPGSLHPNPWPLKPPPLAQETTGLHPLPDGDMLAVYYSGELVRYHARQGTTEEVAHSPAYIRESEVDSHGVTWLCTERGLYRFDGHSLERAGGNVVPDYVFFDAREDAQGRLWFTGEAGLFRLDHDRWTRIHVTGMPFDKGYTHMEITPEGELYLTGDFNGVWHGRITDSKDLAVQHIADDLLDNTRIYFIRHDRRNWLWIGSTEGLVLFNGQQWRRLTEDDGLIWNDIGENAYFEDTNGSIWIGTTNGITHILHPDSLTTPEPLEVVVTQVDLGGTMQIPASSYRFNYAPGLPLTLHLATLGAPTRRTLQYRYRLRGLEHNWVTSDRSQVDYPPLPPGDFVFEVAAYDPDTRQFSQVAELPVHIVPPWWQRTPAILTGLLLLVLSLVLVWQVRTRHLRLRARTLERLVAQRTRELEVDKQALEEARAALWQQATHDALTGLANRSHVLDILAQAIAYARRHRQPLAIALIDLDHFKHINDEYGHLTGDAVLIEASGRMCDTLPENATVGRYGGEEILAVVPGAIANDPTPFEALRQFIAHSPFGDDGTRVHVTCSVGVAWLLPQDRDEFDLIRRADVALYLAKTSGRNRVVLAGESESA